MAHFYLSLSSLLFLAISFGCSPDSGSKYEKDRLSHSPELLYKQHCSRCHALPDPQDLDRKTWREYVLPRMGYFMGIYDLDNPRSRLLEHNAPEVQQLNIFPEQAVLDSVTWRLLVDYIVERAPEQLASDTLIFSEDQQLFQGRFTSAFLSPPGTLLTRFAESGGYFTSDVHKNRLFFSDRKHEIRAALPFAGGIVDIAAQADHLLLTSIGSFSPTDQATGAIYKTDLTQAEPVSRPLIDNLQRPVHTLLSDLNEDGRQDLIIAEYGKWTGGLSWWEQLADGSYQEHALRRMSGALRGAVTDLNNDGLDDILALFGQGDEGIWAFFNEGGGNFREQRLLQFPPSYGSSYMVLVDWNKDGKADILYTNGDNADYPPVVKPYHGIRLFLQQADGTFTEEWFQYLPGAYQARLADFDLDGDLDIVAISFFPDFAHQAEQSLVLFENENNVDFHAQRFAQATLGRWITMDHADNDQDGDLDLIIGSMAFEVVPPTGILQNWINNGLGWLYLENLSKN